MDYLTEAADLLRKASHENDKRGREATAMHSGQKAEADEILREVNDRRMEIADGFIRLAAIKACGPDPEE